MSWLDAIGPRMEAKIKELVARKSFAPDLAFDFDHVKAAVEIVEAAISETQVAAEEVGRARAVDAVARAGAAAAAAKPFSFIEEGIFAGNAAILGNAYLTFPRILRGSLFIAICSHVEHVLRAWCRWLHEDWKLTRDPKAFIEQKDRTTDIDKCMRYLRDEAKLALAGYEQWPEWRIIDTYRIVRNKLAHDGGIVPDGDVAKLTACQEIEVVEPGLLSNERTVHLLPDTCKHATITAKAFFERLSEIGEQGPRGHDRGSSR